MQTIHDGCEGLNTLQNQTQSDAVTLDMHLPGVSADENYAVKWERGKGWRVLLCSADVQLLEQYRSLHANALIKHAQMDELQLVMQEIAPGYNRSCILNNGLSDDPINMFHVKRWQMYFE